MKRAFLTLAIGFGLSLPLAAGLAPAQKVTRHPAKVLFSGLKANANYTEIPTAMVQLYGVTGARKVWIEVQGPDDATPIMVQSATVRGSSRSQLIMTVTKLKRICTEDGVWTVRVWAETAEGKVCLATLPFRYWSNSCLAKL